jgi:hypothetical protein
MPLAVIDGAMAIQPVAGSHGHYSPNAFYDPATTRIAAVDVSKLRGIAAIRSVARRVAAPGSAARRYKAFGSRTVNVVPASVDELT